MVYSLKSVAQAAALVVQNEHADKANTALRIGQLFGTCVDSTMFGLDVSTFGAEPGYTGAVNDAAITAAISAALLNGVHLWWPPGTYASAASIPNLHSVRHRGPGAISRNGDTWYVDPRYGQTNRLYVATTGSATNDGIAFGSYMLTPQNAFDAMRNYGPVLNGTWKVIVSAGTYALHDQTFDTPSRDWVTIQGPTAGHPNVPTAIFNGSGFAANQHGFIISGIGVQAWFQDIKCINYNAGSQNSCGWSQGYAARCIYVNCHADSCDFAGVLADQGDICLVSGGIYNACRDGIVLNATKGTIGYGSPSTAGSNTRITNCTEFGIYWSRGAQGHVDNCLFTNNPYHLRIESAARADVLGNDFRTATVAAIATNTDGSYYDNVSFPNIYNDGTGLANTKRYFTGAYSGKQQNWTDIARSEMLLYFDDTVRTLTSATKAQIGSDLALPTTGGTLPVSYFVDRFSKLRIRVWGETPNAVTQIGVDFYNSVPGVKVMDYRQFVGTPAAGGFEYVIDIVPSNSALQRVFGRADSTANNPRLDSGATTANMALAQTIRLMGQSASGTITVRGVEVWVTG